MQRHRGRSNDQEVADGASGRCSHRDFKRRGIIIHISFSNDHF